MLLTVSQLRGFMGVTNYYSGCVTRNAELAAPLSAKLFVKRADRKKVPGKFRPQLVGGLGSREYGQIVEVRGADGPIARGVVPIRPLGVICSGEFEFRLALV